MTGNIQANTEIKDAIGNLSRGISKKHDIDRATVLETISREAEAQASWQKPTE